MELESRAGSLCAPQLPPHYKRISSDTFNLILMVGGKDAPGARRKLVAGENVKHRRTRSGCLTCRSRRVKVDTFNYTFDDILKG